MQRQGDGRLEAIIIGLDDQVFRSQQTGNGDWKPWRFHGADGNKAKDLVVSRQADGRLEAMLIGLDDHVWRTRQTSP